MLFFSDGPQKTIKFSTIINTIFANFHQLADASISIRCMQKQEELEERKTFKLSKKEIELLVSEYKLTLLKKIKINQKGVGVKFRINNENFDLLDLSEEDEYYDGSIGAYIKALCEEYARIPYYKRERIFFYDKILIIE